MENLWNKSPQNWNAYGLNWQFTYDELTTKRTITASKFKLNIKTSDTTKFASPYLWFKAWAKKNLKKLPSTEETITDEPNLCSPSETQTEIVSTSIIIEELTYDEQNDRLHLERKVERAFYEAGRALRELRDRRLYRNTHRTFEEYCRDRFDYSRRKMDYLIAGAQVFENLEMRTNGSQNLETEMRTIGSQILPTSERQVRPLTKLKPEQQRQVWKSAVKSADGKVPSGRIVKDIVQRIKEKIVSPNPYHVGEVCRIIARDNPELKGKGGQWCIISEVHERCCTVKIYQGKMEVHMDNLLLLDYFPADCEALDRLCDRLQKIYSLNLEDTVAENLNILGKLDRAYLTDFEERLLSLIESVNVHNQMRKSV